MSSMIVELATEVWKSFGMEIVIFTVTLGFAMLLKLSPSPSFASKHTKYAKLQEETTYQFEASANRTVLNRACTPAEQVPTRIPDGPREPAKIVDEVVEGIRDQPGMAFANRALTLHKQLKMRLQASGTHLGEVARCTKHPVIDFYFALIQSAVRVGKPQLIEEIMEDMKQQGVSRTLSFYESAMKQLAGLKHYQLALAMYDHLEADGLEPSAVACSCLISFAAEVGEMQRAIGFFKKLSAITTPSIRAYMTILRVYAKRQDWHASVETFRDMQKRGAPVDSLVLNVILATGVATDQVEGVEALLNEAAAYPTPLTDVVSYNTLIKGLAQRGNSDKAVHVVKQMRQRGLIPNAITFNTAMDAAVRGAKSSEAWSLLKEMRSARLKPDKFTCSILVKGLTKCPSNENIQEVLALLQEVGPSCDTTLQTSMYQVVVEAVAQRAENAVLAQVLAQMRQFKVAPAAATYRIFHKALGKEYDTTVVNEVDAMQDSRKGKACTQRTSGCVKSS